MRDNYLKLLLFVMYAQGQAGATNHTNVRARDLSNRIDFLETFGLIPARSPTVDTASPTGHDTTYQPEDSSLTSTPTLAQNLGCIDVNGRCNDQRECCHGMKCTLSKQCKVIKHPRPLPRPTPAPTPVPSDFPSDRPSVAPTLVPTSVRCKTKNRKCRSNKDCCHGLKCSSKKCLKRG